MALPLYIVDSFSDGPFTGNPAAICLLHEQAADRWMQQVAAEVNLSETAFVFPEGNDFRLRWFSPQMEMDLCGHATLASAHVLWEANRLASSDAARFQTRSGLLTVERKPAGLLMDMPARPIEASSDGAAVAEIIGAEAVFSGRHGMQGLVE